MNAISEQDIDGAYKELGQLDPRLEQLRDRLGTPDPFHFPDGGRTADSNFAGMVMHILAQQIATRVALVIYDRLVTATGGTPTPDTVLRLDPEQLKAIGTSHSKATYVRSFAEAVSSGQLDIEQMDSISDEDAEESLTRVKGIGPWSAEMFLIHQLRRSDILPAGDFGIRAAIRNLDSLPGVPSIADVRARGEAWKPYRTYAASLLWRSVAKPAAAAVSLTPSELCPEWRSIRASLPRTQERGRLPIPALFTHICLVTLPMRARSGCETSHCCSPRE